MPDPVKIMAHCVVYYPDKDRSLAVARGLSRGAAYLEVQFPFSDPSADGPAIQSACQGALEAGFSVQKGFSWIKELSSAAEVPIFLMTYANLPFKRGMKSFCQEAAGAGVQGLIIPDLLPPEDEGFYTACFSSGLSPVPVVSPNISNERLAAVAAGRPRYLYTTLRSGITGSHTDITPGQITHLKRCRRTGAKLLAGFGIESKSQVEALQPHAEVLVVGSYFVKEVINMGKDADPAGIETRMAEKIQLLL